MALESGNERAAVLRSRDSIAEQLQPLLDPGQKTVSFLEGGVLLFGSRLLSADPQAGCVLLASSPNETANRALLAQPRCIFSASVDGWRIEFVAGSPRLCKSDGATVVQLDFPEVLTRWRRSHERSSLAPGVPLQCVADSEGIMPFEALVVDIGPEGLGFLIHADSISLEPGTVLRHCLVEIPGRTPCKVDLEVCYSQSVVLGDGTQSLRSGCRFIDANGAADDLIRFYLASVGGHSAPDGEPKRDLV